jgi:hypothetical protein
MKLTYRMVHGSKHMNHVHHDYENSYDEPSLELDPGSQPYCCYMMEDVLRGNKNSRYPGLVIQVQDRNGLGRIALRYGLGTTGTDDPTEQWTVLQFCPWCGERVEAAKVADYDWVMEPTGKTVTREIREATYATRTVSEPEKQPVLRKR